MVYTKSHQQLKCLFDNITFANFDTQQRTDQCELQYKFIKITTLM